jgi:hypothetical protein
MLAAGVTAEVLAAAWKAEIAKQEEVVAVRRAKDADRQRRHRESRDVTVTRAVSALVTTKGSPKVSPGNPLPNHSESIPLNPPEIRFKNEWNEMAGKHGLPHIDCIKGKRLKALNARRAEHGDDEVSKTIAAVPGSPHWLGENGWLGNFDSLMRPDNFQRMKEGAYSASKNGKASARYVSASGYEYRGSLEQIEREAQRRHDNDTYWQVQVDKKQEHLHA